MDRHSAQAEHGKQRLIDSPQLLRRHVSHEHAQSTSVDSSNLFDKHSCRFAVYVDLGTERRGPGAFGGGSNQHERTGEQLVRLHDNAETPALLFVSTPARNPKFVDLTPEHACSP